MATKKKKQKAVEEEVEQEQVVARKVFTLRLSARELAHIRDLFSITLPTGMKKTISQQLAHIEARLPLEAKLWQKVVEQCNIAGVPLGEEAPDYYAAPASLPEIGVFPVDNDHYLVDEEPKE